MKKELQVCTIEQAQKLRELGAPQKEAIYFWDEDGSGNLIRSLDASARLIGCVAAYTVAELGEMLPAYMTSKEDGIRGFLHSIDVSGDGWECYYERNDMGVAMHNIQTGKTEAQARAAMLIYLLENKLITLKD